MMNVDSHIQLYSNFYFFDNPKQAVQGMRVVTGYPTTSSLLHSII